MEEIEVFVVCVFEFLEQFFDDVDVFTLIEGENGSSLNEKIELVMVEFFQRVLGGTVDIELDKVDVTEGKIDVVSIY